MKLRFPHLPLVGVVALLLAWPPVEGMAREAAFVQPGAAAGKGTTAEALIAEPKELDTGESISGIARRVTLFFSNASAMPVSINNMSVNGDSNVSIETVSNDCKDTAKIPSGSRCAVVMSITPSSPGPWSVEILATHDGVGRIARAQVSGETLGDKKGDKQTMGLAMSGQKVEPVDFGEVEANMGDAVRSALVSNDSAEDLTILSIDLVSPSNGLGLLEQGCEVDQTLKAGESCPITLRWVPEGRGTVSTDLIVRHTGRVGFIVIPIRGKAVGDTDFVIDTKGKKGKKKKTDEDSELAEGETRLELNPSNTTSAFPPAGGTSAAPPTAPMLDDLAKSLPPLSAEDIKGAASGLGLEGEPKKAAPKVTLIGTVGQKGIFKVGSETVILAVGASATADDTPIKVLKVTPRSAEIDVGGETKVIELSQNRVISNKPSSSKGGGELLDDEPL